MGEPLALTLDAARSAIMADMTNCPVCGAASLGIEKSDNLETIEFICDAAFYLQTGSIIAVSRTCSAPTHVAIRHLENLAEKLAAKEAA